MVRIGRGRGSRISFDEHWAIASCWIAGLILGAVFAAVFGVSFSSLMGAAASSRVSIVSLATTALLPFLFSALAVYMGRPKLLALICACKAFGFAFCAYLAILRFGSAGWLIQPLLQFTQISLAPFFCWFSIRHICGDTVSIKRDLTVCICAALLLSGLDALIVSPFLSGLINF